MIRPFIPVLCAGLLLAGCASQKTTPDPTPASSEAPKAPEVAQVPASKRFYAEMTKRSLHQRALSFPIDVDVDPSAYKPCEVRVDHTNGVEVRRLAFDDEGRLNQIVLTQLAPDQSVRASRTMTMEYDAQDNLTKLAFDNGVSTTFGYDAGIMNRATLINPARSSKLDSTVTHSSSGNTVLLEQILPEGAQGPPVQMAYTYDDKGRLIFKALGPKLPRAQWIYKDGSPQIIEHYPKEFGNFKDTYTVQDGKLQSAIRAIRTEDDSFSAIEEATFIYEGDRLSSAKRVDPNTGKQLEAIAYIYTCQ